MFAEEAQWLRERITVLSLPDAPRVLDIGSQTADFRRNHQAHVETDIHAPLRVRGARFTTVDIQDADGVDVVADVTARDFDSAIGPFDLVLCTNLLEHVTDRDQTVRNLESVTAAGGHLVVTVPGYFPYHADPIDTMYRPTPTELVADVVRCAPALAPLVRRSIRVLDDRWYLSRKAKLRRLIPPLTWRTSAAVFRRV